jgi:hypothetical protein
MNRQVYKYYKVVRPSLYVYRAWRCKLLTTYRLITTYELVEWNYLLFLTVHGARLEFIIDHL